MQIKEHILKHGDIRKKTKVEVAGQQVEVDTFVEEEDEETVKAPADKYAGRPSFQRLRE